MLVACWALCTSVDGRRRAGCERAGRLACIYRCRRASTSVYARLRTSRDGRRRARCKWDL